MYYLFTEKDNKIVDSCKHAVHRDVIINVYCSNNNIKIVKDMNTLKSTCVENGLYCYKVTDNQYVVLDCIYHPVGYLFNYHVEGKILYYLNFLYFDKNEHQLNSCVNEIKNIKIWQHPL